MPATCRVYVGNLPHRARERELDDIFYKAGRIRGIEVKKGGFGFIDFDHPEDAEYAVKKFNGIELHGRRLRVEVSLGHTRSQPPKSSGYAMQVTGVTTDKKLEWRALKDWARRGGEVTYAKISENATVGYVEFASEKDLERAVAELNGSSLLGCTVSVKRTEPISTRDRDSDRGNGRSASRRDGSRERRRGNSRERRDRNNNNRRSRSRSPRRNDARKDRDRAHRSRSPRPRSASPDRRREESDAQSPRSPRRESRSRSPARGEAEETSSGDVMNLLSVEESSEVLEN